MNRKTRVIDYLNIVEISKYSLLLIFILIFQEMSFSQSIQKIDSLNKLSSSFKYVNNDSMYITARESLEKSLEAGYLMGQITAYTNLCYSCYIKADYDAATGYCDNAIKLSQSEINDFKDITTAYQFLGLTQVNTGELNQAILTFSELIKISVQLNNNFVLADACSNMGLAHLTNKDFSKAKQYYLKSLKIHNNIDYPDGKVYVYHNIGRIYFGQKDYINAKTFLENSAKLAKEINNYRALFYNYTLLGQVGDPFDTESEQILLHAMQIADSLELNFEKPDVKLYLAQLYFKRKEYGKSQEYAENAIVYAKQRNTSELLLKLYDLLIKSYTLDEKYAEAEKYTELYNIISKKDNGSEKNILFDLLNLSEMAAEDQDYIVAKQELARERNQHYQRYTIITSVIISISLIIIIFFTISRYNRKISSLKNQLDRQNNRHESDIKKAYSQLIKFKNDQLLNDIELSKEQKDQLDAIKKTVAIDSQTIL